MTTYFTQDHEWIRVEGDVATVGISNHAQEQLGDIVFAEVPEAGKQLSKGAEAAVVEVPRAGPGQPGRMSSIHDGAAAEQWFPAIANFGKRPTFVQPGEETRIRLEAHLLNFAGDLYGKMLEVRFLKFHRGEQKFSGPQALKEQIERDVQARSRAQLC